MAKRSSGPEDRALDGDDDKPPGPTLTSGPMEIGEVWGYRARQIDPLVRVEVLKIGTRRPARVQMRFLDEQFEGRQEWVPPARLKVLWGQAEQWLTAERRWLAVVDGSAHARETLEHEAAQRVFDRPNVEEFIDQMDAYRYAVLTVTSPAAFVAKLGYAAAELATEPGYIRDDGTVVAAWPALLTVAQQVAKLDAEPLLAELDRDDARAEREATYGYWTRIGGEDHHISAEICAETGEEFKQARDLVRQWCGAEARDRRDELKALREEVLRLGHLIEKAITTLRQAGCDGAARDLERELGIPVADLRKDRHTNQ